jgi:hypothetical protein
MSDDKNPIEPRCKALLLCECAIIEEGTQKVSLINIFEDIAVPGFPGETPALTLFA